MDNILYYSTPSYIRVPTANRSRRGTLLSIRTMEKKRRRETTKGWEVCIKWKYGSSTWNQVKDIKYSFPVKLAEYVLLNQISDEPEFAWWIKKVLKKIDRIISKTARKYWQKTHKYRLRIPHTVKEVLYIEKENGETLWWDAIL